MPLAYFQFATVIQLRAWYWEQQQAICHYYYCYAWAYFSHVAYLSLSWLCSSSHRYISNMSCGFQLGTKVYVQQAQKQTLDFVFVFVLPLGIKAHSFNKRLSIDLSSFYIRLWRHQIVWNTGHALKESLLVKGTLKGWIVPHPVPVRSTMLFDKVQTWGICLQGSISWPGGRGITWDLCVLSLSWNLYFYCLNHLEPPRNDHHS